MTRVDAPSIPSKWSRPAREQRLLTAHDRELRAVSERDFQRQVCDLALILGWQYVHWRPLRNGRGIWQVPVEGPLGKGWPDLTLVRARDRRLIFAELKREAEDPKPDQVAVLEQLSALDDPLSRTPAPFRSAVRLEVYVWRPGDLVDPIETSTVGRILR